MESIRVPGGLTGPPVYSLLYGKAPSGNAFTADLNLAEARLLQEVAASMVARQPARNQHGN